MEINKKIEEMIAREVILDIIIVEAKKVKHGGIGSKMVLKIKVNKAIELTFKVRMVLKGFE